MSDLANLVERWLLPAAVAMAWKVAKCNTWVEIANERPGQSGGEVAVASSGGNGMEGGKVGDGDTTRNTWLETNERPGQSNGNVVVASGGGTFEGGKVGDGSTTQNTFVERQSVKNLLKKLRKQA
eukprot:TRINITY_DN659_c0_g1_i4.p1 TRINITY_DN659_c0_g1~~TRINITY_DN659_c0_g1_i4.p1  ORF type:complete len:125 (+),score=33.96 TRINITY_DN659_c0_g1_i4:48-422(+)